MTLYLLILCLLLPILVGFSAFFSGSETALFSLSRARLLAWRDAADKARQAVIELMSTYHYTLIALILGNMFVNVGISMVEDEIIQSLAVNKLLSEIISVFLAVFLLLIFGEITPKAIALAHTDRLALKLARPIRMLRFVMMPLIRFVSGCFARILDLLGRRHSEPLSPEEYAAYLSASYCGGAFSPAEKELLESALRINTKQVIDVMTGRVDILTVSRYDEAEVIGATLRRSRQSYFPVIAEDIDDADYLLLTKRFFMLTPDERRDWQHSDAVIPVRFIPEHTSVLQALAHLVREKVSAALVTDEYGRIAGLVTREDIFAEMIGDIDDEYDRPDYTATRTGDEAWSFSGMIPCYFFEETTGWKLPDELESTTVNGLFAELSGRLPRPGDTLRLDRLVFRAESVAKRRVIRFNVRQISPETPEAVE